MAVKLCVRYEYNNYYYSVIIPIHRQSCTTSSTINCWRHWYCKLFHCYCIHTRYIVATRQLIMARASTSITHIHSEMTKPRNIHIHIYVHIISTQLVYLVYIYTSYIYKYIYIECIECTYILRGVSWRIPVTARVATTVMNYNCNHRSRIGEFEGHFNEGVNAWVLYCRTHLQ